MPSSYLHSSTTITLHFAGARDVVENIAVLSDLLIEAVDGSTLGFTSPVPRAQALDYWRSVGPELDDGRRLMLLARDAAQNHRVVGSGQLALSGAPNARHRAEVQKVFVSSRMRGRGLGRRLMYALHAAARAHDRTLILLGTRCGGAAERLYRSLGYREIGVVPGYAMGNAGERYDNAMFYLELT
jgi:ribosomal protein S18 acetylase RimI-like enzyme